MKKVLITGGAGYIGLNMTVELINRGIDVVIIDNLKNSYANYISSLISKYPDNILFIRGDVCNKDFMDNVFKNNNFDGVIHLSAYKYVGESFKKSKEYMYNNLTSLQVVLDCVDKYKIKRIFFASSVTVYGNNGGGDESSIMQPISPYSETKKLGEEMLNAWKKKNKFTKVIIFRFANPMGANVEFNLGNHSKKGFRNLMGDLVHHAVMGEKLILRGNTHPTKDGTPVRDFIHISDLTTIAITVFMFSQKDICVYNLGRGEGFSVLEMVKMTENVTGKKIDYSFTDRMEGDISVLETNIDSIKKDYDISFNYGLREMIDSEYKFYLRNIKR